MKCLAQNIKEERKRKQTIPKCGKPIQRITRVALCKSFDILYFDQTLTIKY